MVIFKQTGKHMRRENSGFLNDSKIAQLYRMRILLLQ